MPASLCDLHLSSFCTRISIPFPSDEVLFHFPYTCLSLSISNPPSPVMNSSLSPHYREIRLLTSTPDHIHCYSNAFSPPNHDLIINLHHKQGYTMRTAREKEGLLPSSLLSSNPLINLDNKITCTASTMTHLHNQTA
jgi:hypothetical protein